MPVVVGGGFGGVLFHEMTGHGLEADHIQKGASVYVGKLGEQVAQPLLTAYDDGRMPNEWGSDAIDDEGAPTQKTMVIEEGRLTAFLYDGLTARREGVASTGNGRRESFRHLPVPRMTNTYIAPGDAEPEAMIAEVQRGFYAVSFAGGQVDPATGDFVFGVSEGYLIEGGKVTRPCRGATLIGNCLEALAAIDAVGNDFEMKTGVCGKARPEGAGRNRPGPRPHPGDDRRGDRGLIELASPARSRRQQRRAPAMPRPTRPRTAAARCAPTVARSRVSPRRPSAGSESGPGSARGSATPTAPISPRRVWRRSPSGPRKRHGSPTRTSSPPAGPRTFRCASAIGPQGAPEAGSARDPTLGDWAPDRLAELALAIERAALGADSRIAGVEQAVYADSAERVAIASSLGIDGEYSSSSCYGYVQALAESEDGRETGLGFGLGRGPAALDPAAIGREGAERADSDDRRRQAEVALLSGRPRPDRRGQLCRPDRQGLGGKRGAARALPVRRAARR